MAYDLERFVTEQRNVYDHVLAELRSGRKTGHWIWFIFPQVAGLGRSWMSQRFAIASLAEARAYIDHPVLGPRLREVTAIVLATPDRTAEEIFGSLDAMKVRSSMTLFASRRAGGAALRRAAGSLLRRRPRRGHGRPAGLTRVRFEALVRDQIAQGGEAAVDVSEGRGQGRQADPDGIRGAEVGDDTASDQLTGEIRRRGMADRHVRASA